MKKYILKSAFVIVALVVLSCNNDDDRQSIWLPVNMEIIYPAAAASYQTLDISYNSQFLIQNVTSLEFHRLINYNSYYEKIQLTNHIFIFCFSGKSTGRQKVDTTGVC